MATTFEADLNPTTGSAGPPPAATPPNRAVRRAWRVTGAVFVVLGLGFGGLQVVLLASHDTRDIQRTFPAAGVRTIEVHGLDGPIQVVGGQAGDTIRVRAHIDDGLRKTHHAEAVHGDRLVLNSSCPVLLSQHCEVSYVIETPSNVSVDVHTGDSRVTVSDIRGDVDVSDADGGVSLARIAGAVRVSTADGRIDATALTSDTVDASSSDGHVSVAFTQPPRAVNVHTADGGVEVVLPRGDTQYKVDAHSVDGGTSTDVNTSPTSPRTISASTTDGSVIVRYP